MSAQRAVPSINQDDLEGDQAIAVIDRLRAEIAAANPDMSDQDWNAFAERWAEEVNEGLRRHVRRQRGELGPTAP